MTDYSICPVVCVVEDRYQIMVPLAFDALVSIKIGEREFFNHSCGVRRSATRVHRFDIPQRVLDSAREYTVVVEPMLCRGAYSCIKGEIKEQTFSFRPLTKETDINIYHISDSHGRYKSSVRAASYFGDELDLLILNGDISSSSESVADIMLSYKIAFDVTHGGLPVIISRGNHDLRGVFAEKLEELMPVNQGHSYYNVRLGNLFMSLVDLGEDKLDSNREYSGTAAFHGFRLDETDFLKDTVEKHLTTYDAEGVKYKFIVSHVAFTVRDGWYRNEVTEFDIENEIYDEWTAIFREKIKPDFLLAGHYHKTEIWRPDSFMNCRNAPFPVIVGGKPFDGDAMAGCALTLHDGCADVVFNDDKMNIIGKEVLEFPVY